MRTVKIKLLPTIEQENHLISISKTYIKTVNETVSEMVGAEKVLKLTSKDVGAPMPSAVKNQAIRDAKSVYKKSKKLGTVPVLKKPVCTWNNQNYNVNDGSIDFPLWIKGKCMRVEVEAVFDEYQTTLINNAVKFGALRITQKSDKWIAQIAIEEPELITVPTNIVMGVDLGLKVPAVAKTSDGKVRFFGNGRMNKFFKRRFRALRKKLGQAKKLSVIKKLHDKEQRWMKDQDHKISRAIINFAIENHVSVIRLEELSGIRQTAKTSRKNEKNLHTWSFYRLANYIEYKAALAGIRVEYVNPAYTSQICPVCGQLNKAKGRNYTCDCGYHAHRDLVGASNIINAPVIADAA
jgi:putative transposase